MHDQNSTPYSFARAPRRPVRALRQALASISLILGAAGLVAACGNSSAEDRDVQSNMPSLEADPSSESGSPDLGSDNEPATAEGDESPSEPGATGGEPSQDDPSEPAASEDPTAGVDELSDGELDPSAGDASEDGAGELDGDGDDAMVDEGNDQEPEPEPEPEPELPAPFAPCPTDGSACAIMPLGDSITDGVGSSGGGYRVELFRQAVQNGKNVTFVGTQINGPNNVAGQPFPRAHQGHSGFTISGGGAGSLAGRWDAAIDVVDPHIVLLMIGTNDINGNIDVGNAPARLGALLDQMTSDAPDALIVVAQIVPTTNPGTNMRVTAYNDAVAGVVQQRIQAGRHLQLLDMFTPFVSTPNFGNSLMNDFLHPNDAGYVVMGQTWFEAIESVLPE